MTDKSDNGDEDSGRFVLIGGDVTGGRGIDVDRSIEPGSPAPEHVLFVLLGATATIVLFLDGVGLL